MGPWEPCDANPNHPDVRTGDRVLRIVVDMQGIPGYDSVVPSVGGTIIGFATRPLGVKTYGTVIEWNDGSISTSMFRDFSKV